MEKLHCFVFTDFTRVVHIHKTVWSHTVTTGRLKENLKFKDELQPCL